jgi:hypothetical protein
MIQHTPEIGIFSALAVAAAGAARNPKMMNAAMISRIVLFISISFLHHKQFERNLSLRTSGFYR